MAATLLGHSTYFITSAIHTGVLLEAQITRPISGLVSYTRFKANGTSTSPLRILRTAMPRTACGFLVSLQNLKTHVLDRGSYLVTFAACLKTTGQLMGRS